MNKKFDYAGIIYIITLICTEYIITAYCAAKWQLGTLGMIVLILLGILVHGLFYVAITVLYFYILNRKFEEEYAPIVKNWMENKDPELLLQSLQNMKAAPRSREAKNTFYVSMSTAYFETGQREEAKAYLRRVETENPSIRELVRNQMDMIEEKEQEE